MTKTELRRYCRESGHCTRLSKNRIMLHQDDVANLIEWVRESKAKAKAAAAEQQEYDPFA